MGRFCFTGLKYRRLRLTVGVCLLLAGPAAAALAWQTTLRVDVQLVRVLATVKNTAGQPVGTLRKEDFSITDNGVPQTLSVFERRTEQPLSVSLLLDESGSIGKEQKYLRESTSRFFSSFFAEGHPDDAIALYSFNWEVRLLNSFTRRRGLLETRLLSLKPEAGTAMYDAIFLASGELAGRDGRHVMVVVTDGGDTVSSKRYHDALEAAQQADAVFYSILLMPITNDAGRNIGGENALSGLATATGGRVFPPGTPLDRAFAEILQDLRTQYLLAYYPRGVPPTRERFHRLRVSTLVDGLTAIARSGYYGESSPFTEREGRRKIGTPVK